MNRMKYQSIVLIAAFAIAIPSAALAQTGPSYLGLVPEGAVVAGQVHIHEILDIDRLERLVNSWGAVLGEQADVLIAEMREDFNRELAPFANNVQYCVVYALTLDDNAPVTICEGTFGEAGFTPPEMSEIQVVSDNVMITGSQRAEAAAQLDSAAGGTATLAGITIDPSLLAHFVVSFPPELMAQMGGSPLPIPASAFQSVEVKLSQDDTQLGSMALEVRVTTDSAESAALLNVLLMAIVSEMAVEPEFAVLGLSAEDIQSWLSVEGNAIVLRPSTEAIALSTAIAIPAFLQYVETAEGVATPPMPPPPTE